MKLSDAANILEGEPDCQWRFGNEFGFWGNIIFQVGSGDAAIGSAVGKDDLENLMEDEFCRFIEYMREKGQKRASARRQIGFEGLLASGAIE